MAKRLLAIAFGTITGSQGHIYHFNPESTDDAAKYPLVQDEDIERVKKDGLAKDLDDATVAELNRAAGSNDLSDLLYAKQQEQAVETDKKLGFDKNPALTTSTLGGQAITAYPEGDKAMTGREGLNPDAAPGVPLSADGAAQPGSDNQPRNEGGEGTGGEGEGGEKPKEPSILDKSVPDLTAELENINDVDQLKALRQMEETGKTRATALAAIDARIGALEA